jgi:hypothetical protein
MHAILERMSEPERASEAALQSFIASTEVEDIIREISRNDKFEEDLHGLRQVALPGFKGLATRRVKEELGRVLFTPSA